MSEPTKKPTTEVHCAGSCRHTEKYHVVHVSGTSDVGCCMMDCLCMKFVPEKPQ